MHVSKIVLLIELYAFKCYRNNLDMVAQKSNNSCFCNIISYGCRNLQHINWLGQNIDWALYPLLVEAWPKKCILIMHTCMCLPNVPNFHAATNAQSTFWLPETNLKLTSCSNDNDIVSEHMAHIFK